MCVCVMVVAGGGLYTSFTALGKAESVDPRIFVLSGQIGSTTPLGWHHPVRVKLTIHQHIASHTRKMGERKPERETAPSRKCEGTCEGIKSQVLGGQAVRIQARMVWTMLTWTILTCTCDRRGRKSTEVPVFVNPKPRVWTSGLRRGLGCC